MDIKITYVVLKLEEVGDIPFEDDFKTILNTVLQQIKSIVTNSMGSN